MKRFICFVVALSLFVFSSVVGFSLSYTDVSADLSPWSDWSVVSTTPFWSMADAKWSPYILGGGGSVPTFGYSYSSSLTVTTPFVGTVPAGATYGVRFSSSHYLEPGKWYRAHVGFSGNSYPSGMTFWSLKCPSTRNSDVYPNFSDWAGKLDETIGEVVGHGSFGFDCVFRVLESPSDSPISFGFDFMREYSKSYYTSISNGTMSFDGYLEEIVEPGQEPKTLEDWLSDIYNALVGGGSGEGGGSAGEQIAPGLDAMQGGQQQIEDFEGGLWSDVTDYSAQVDPGTFSLGTSIVTAISWVSVQWVNLFNNLGEWKAVVTFPMFLGIALLVIGRGGYAIANTMTRHGRASKTVDPAKPGTFTKTPGEKKGGS